MTKLMNMTRQKELAQKLTTAKTFSQRLVGLIGQTEFTNYDALWIPKCTSIHTFFMKMNIDAIFVDNNFVVQKCYSNLKPGKVTLPSLKFSSVFELPVGSIQKTETQIGDQLNVVD